ncbi:MAG: type III pantothenate kinase [Nitrospirae bacterium]|nr:type III pantothenate kinase [Nitrospirota bacterium]
MKSLLCIDIGNSTIGLAFFADPLQPRTVIKKIQTHPAKKPDHYKKILGAILRKHKLSGNNIDAIVSSVVPSLNGPVLKSLHLLNIPKPLLLTHKTNTGLHIDTRNPLKLGSDRIANAVAGFAITKKPCAVVDFGTATTITVVGKNKNILGGSILPGIQLMANSLACGTAKLPHIKKTKPIMALGRDTYSAMLSGVMFGSAGAVETIVQKIEKELGFKLQLLSTGGNSEAMSSMLNRKNSYTADLIFQGLRLIYLKNTD